eukprot:4570239-Amphidinium_carterae.1
MPPQKVWQLHVIGNVNVQARQVDEEDLTVTIHTTRSGWVVLPKKSLSVWPRLLGDPFNCSYHL